MIVHMAKAVEAHANPRNSGRCCFFTKPTLLSSTCDITVGLIVNGALQPGQRSVLPRLSPVTFNSLPQMGHGNVTNGSGAAMAFFL